MRAGYLCAYIRIHTANAHETTKYPTEGEALAEACEDRGVQAVLAIVLSPGEAEVVRRPGLKALARLASDSHQKLLEIGTHDRTGHAFCPPQTCAPCLCGRGIKG